MMGTHEYVSWYDNPRAREQEEAAAAGKDGNTGEPQTTDPSTVNLQAGVYNKVAKAFSQLFTKNNNRLDRKHGRIGWTTTGELGVLRQEQDSQYEFMEELELKIEELKKEVDLQKALIRAYEVKMKQNEQYLQHCMHWITMAQVFGDVPVAKDRMNWKPGRDAALIGPDEDDDDEGLEPKAETEQKK